MARCLPYFSCLITWNMTVDEIKDLMCKARQPTSLEIKIGENVTALVDLLEDETQLPDTLLERQFIKEDIRHLID